MTLDASRVDSFNPVMQLTRAGGCPVAGGGLGLARGDLGAGVSVGQA